MEGMTINPDPHSGKREVHIHESVDVLTIITDTSSACLDCGECTTGNVCPELTSAFRDDLARIDELFAKLNLVDMPFAIANRIREEKE